VSFWKYLFASKQKGGSDYHVVKRYICVGACASVLSANAYTMTTKLLRLHVEAIEEYFHVAITNVWLNAKCALSNYTVSKKPDPYDFWHNFIKTSH